MITLNQKYDYLRTLVIEKPDLDKYDAQILVYIEILELEIKENLKYLNDIEEIIKYSHFLRLRCLDTKQGFVYRCGNYNPIHDEILAMFTDNIEIGMYFLSEKELVLQHQMKWWHFYHLRRYLDY